ncbi:MAG TPA: saccharopine dehydrogenase NADP-binding domain-containing protein [Thermoanaerobaculia bacterium]|jgi:short subunit dehydrogenase-like uncharacterized protein
MSRDLPPVAVLGATGHTGRFVVAELLARGLTPILAGRSPERLEEVAASTPVKARRAVDMADPASLDAALAGAGAVINCAGPFFDTALPVIDAALRARIPYVDVTAEQATVLTIYAERDAQARAAAVPVVPGMAFYGGLGDLLATAAAGEWTEPDAIDLAVALDSWHPTQGTRETGRRNTARRLIGDQGKLVPLPDPPPRRHWTFPDPFGPQDVLAVPLTEIVLISRHIRAGKIISFMNQKPLADLRDPATSAPVAVDERGRSAQRFVLDVVVQRGGEERRATASGQDIYAVTAPLVVEAAQRLLSGQARKANGTLAPGELFDARAFLSTLAPEHLRVSFPESSGI